MTPLKDYFIAIGFAMAVSVGASQSFAQVLTNFMCVPIAAPVTTCDCPLGPHHADRCEGSLPKSGNMYGDVACTAIPAVNCDAGGGGGANPCGRVVMCPCIACGTPIIFLGCTCVVFEDKPPCQNTWGGCVYP